MKAPVKIFFPIKILFILYILIILVCCRLIAARLPFDCRLIATVFLVFPAKWGCGAKFGSYVLANHGAVFEELGKSSPSISQYLEYYRLRAV
jgi:hypothetical protein